MEPSKLKKRVPASLPGTAGHSDETKRSDTSLISASPQQIVAKLKTTAEQVDRLPVLEGEPGAQLLYALEYLDHIRDAIRARMRDAIYEQEGLVPGWHVEVVEIKKLCRDKEDRS